MGQIRRLAAEQVVRRASALFAPRAVNQSRPAKLQGRCLTFDNQSPADDGKFTPRLGIGTVAPRRLKLRTIEPPSTGSVVHAPPPITLTANTIQYLCGRCEALLLVADAGQVHGVVIQCKACGSYNQAEI